MITVQDTDLILSMVGPVFKNGYPSDFTEEYKIRLGMLARAGTVGGLGTVALMQLLRDFDVKPENAPVRNEVSDWRQIPQGTVIYTEGRRGTFDSMSSDGRLLVKIDGYRALHEVNASTVMVKGDFVEGVKDEAFERDPDDAPSAAVILEEEKNKPASKADMLFAAWQGVEAGEKVMVEFDGKTIEAEFVDIEGEEIFVNVDGKLQAFEPQQVTPTVKA